MLVELAVGDAYGAGFEYANPEVVRQHNDLSGYRPHPLGVTRGWAMPAASSGSSTRSPTAPSSSTASTRAATRAARRCGPARWASSPISTRCSTEPGCRRRCVACTGDVDTVALAAGSCATDLPQDLPAQLVTSLENGAYGRDHLADIDTRLHRS